MIKFMRKHNKKLLAIFASGLLVVWLGSSALQEMFRPDTGEEAAGQAFGQEFSGQELSQAHVRTEVLSSMGVFWNQPWGGGVYRLPIKPIDRLTWFLLDLEARRSGIEVPEREVQRFLMGSGIPGKRLEMIRDRRGISIARIMGTLADHIRIGRLGQLAAAAVTVSMPELEHFVRDTQEKVTVRMAVLRASDFADTSGDPDPARLEKQFYEFRERLPGEGDQGYGYKWPDRVRVEYLVADVDKIEASLKIPRDEVRDYWSKHRKDYTKQVPLASAPATQPRTQPTTVASRPEMTSQPATTSQATASAPTTSTRPVTKTVVKTFAEAYEDVLTEMRKDRAPTVAERLVRQAAERLFEPWYDLLPNEETGYKTPPVGVDAPDYLTAVAADVCARNDLPVEALRVVKPARWLTRADAAELEGIGQAVVAGRTTDADMPSEFSELAFRVQGLYTPSERGSRDQGLATYQTFNTPLRDTKDGEFHNYYLFRVVAAEAEHVPKAIDEIKDTLRKDVIERAGYQRAGASAKKLLAAARAKGIDAAVKADAALAKRLGEEGVIEPEPFARKRSLGQVAIQFGLPLATLSPIEELDLTEERKIGAFPVPMEVVIERLKPEVKKLIDTCFGLAAKSTAKTKPARSVALVEMPRCKQWIVVEFVRIDRVQATDYVKNVQQIMQLIESDRILSLMRTWYDPEQVKQRTAYAPASGEQEG